MANYTMHHLNVGSNTYEMVDEQGRANIAPSFSTSTTYAAGDYVIYGRKLYQFTAAHTGVWTGTDAEETTVTEKLGGGSGDGLTEDIKQALLQIAAKVAYIDEHGQDYYDALYDALYPHADLVSISAVYTQSGTVYDSDTLDSLRADLVVTATYSDQTTQTVTVYTLSGTLTEGTSTITVTYGGKTTTFSVTVEEGVPSGYTRLKYVTANGNQYVNTGINETQAAKSEYEVMITAQPKVNGNHILSSNNIYFPFLKGGTASDPDWQIYCGASNKGNQTFEISDVVGVTDYAWEMNRKYKLSGFPDIYIDGVFVDRLPEGSTASASNMLTLFTYGGNTGNANYRFHGNLYWCKIYDSTNNLLRNFIPAKNSSNVVGLYDTVSDTFYTSATASALIAGEVA